MDDRGYVRTYTRKGRRRRRSPNRGGIIAIVVLCLIIAALVLTLVMKMVSRNEDKPENTTTTTASSMTTTLPNGTANGTQEGTTAAPVTTQPAVITGEIENGALKIKVDDEKWMLTLVNKYYTVGEDYTPPELVKLSGSDGASGGNGKLDARAAEYFEKMYAQCLEDTGVILNTVSAYRTYEYQDGLYQRQVEREISRGLSEDAAKIKAATIVARPGTSDHNLGLAVDIGRITDDFENSKGYKWLDQHAHEYGFVLRYPKDKQEITHVIYEPWHWRYVGVEAAKEMKESGQVLEEYLDMVDEPAALSQANE